MRKFFITAILSVNTIVQLLAQNGCVESNRWKFEDYTQKPFFANQIFAKGYGVYFLFQSRKTIDFRFKDSVENIILNGFRVALTNWGVSLLMNKDKLSSEIKKYLEDNSFKNGGNSTYNAPMVFKVDCVENSNFVIQVYFQGGKKIGYSNSVLAMAQIKGRTILINMQTQSIIYEQKLFSVQSLEKDYNIAPILAHELGHCFGMVHFVSPTSKSIMADRVNLISPFPTQTDGLALANILASKLKGTSAGYFNPTECAGLKTK